MAKVNKMVAMKAIAKCKAKAQSKAVPKSKATPKSKAKAKTECKDKGTKTITEESLSLQGEMTLDEKMKLMMQKGKFDMELDPNEWKKLNLRFTQTVLPKSSSEVKDLWASLGQKGQRVGKQAGQREVLKAFVLDPQLGDKFFSLSKTVSLSDRFKMDEEWISRKALLNEMSESEAEEQVRVGAIKVRTNPDCPGRLQFLKVKKVKTKVVDKTSKASVSGATKVSDEDHKGIDSMFQTLEVGEKLFKKGSSNMQLMLGNMMVDSDDEGQPSSSNKKPKKLLPFKISKDSQEGKDEPDDAEGTGKEEKKGSKGKTASVEGLDTAEQGFQKCEKMAQLLDSRSVQLRTLQEQMKKSMYGAPKVIGQLRDTIVEVGHMKEELQNIHIQKRASLTKTKERLVDAAKLLQVADGLVKTNRAIINTESGSQKGK